MYLLFCHGHHRGFIHPHIGDSHAAEDSKSFHKVFIITEGENWVSLIFTQITITITMTSSLPSEGEVVKLVDQLEDTQHPEREMSRSITYPRRKENKRMRESDATHYF